MPTAARIDRLLASGLGPRGVAFTAAVSAWEARYGYPALVVQDGQERRYSRQELDALATRLQTELAIAAAIQKARLAGT